jgi:cytidyltransferase-like protein
MHRKQIIVAAGFDDLRSQHTRFLEEASRLGELTVLLWPDEMLERLTGRPPMLPLAERLYILNAIRYVSRVVPLEAPMNPDALPALAGLRPGVWVDSESGATEAREKFCRTHGLEYRVLSAEQLKGFPEPPASPAEPGRKKVIVTGCYDWFHSGHVRFFEEVSAYGDLYVTVGHDANIRSLKGAGHPLHPQEERRYMVGSVRFVKQALIASGNGWLDAEPEIRRLKPDIYVVNEDGDRGGKREFCAKRGIQYIVLKREPAPGLPRRTSTDLRGF